MISNIDSLELIEAGMIPGRMFGKALAEANRVLQEGGSRESAIAAALALQPIVQPILDLAESGSRPYFRNIEVENEHEVLNLANVDASMIELMRTPVVRAGAIMPDACPAGPLGTIPVGGIVASEAIHPGMHSADICCSMGITVFKDTDPKALLDAVHSVAHFGPGGRPRGQQIRPSDEIMARFADNDLLSDLSSLAIEHNSSSGDGNHFCFVGTLASTGETALVTHWGSRAPGAKLYGKGMKIAERFRAELSPETLKQNAWIPADTKIGEEYWEALQIITAWTEGSHFAIHEKAAELLGAKTRGRQWNPHNTAFRKSDGLFYHAKGATPAFEGWSPDAGEFTLIPLNMAEPVLITRGKNADHGLGFSPHGAGRNFSRTQHKRLNEGRTVEEIFAEETAGLDARFFSGIIDISELPSAYKNADAVRRQIESFGLAEIVDEVLPFGSIMAGDWEKNAPWRKKRDRRA